MTKYILAIALVGMAGCSLFSPAQQQAIGQQIVTTGAQQTTCGLNQLASTSAAWMAQNPSKTPTAVQLTSWAEQAAFTCAARYPMIISVPSAVATPAQ